MIERPVFIVAPPRSGAAALHGSLARAPGVFTAVGDRPSVFDAVYELNPANRDWDSNRLTAADARAARGRGAAFEPEGVAARPRRRTDPASMPLGCAGWTGRLGTRSACRS